MRYKIFEYPPGVGLEAFGENFKETFENSAYGLFSLISDINDIQPKESFEIKIKGADREELLINWLNELIYIGDSKKYLLGEFRIYQLSDKELKAHAAGEKINREIHVVHRSIKAATYNQLEVGEKKVKVIFDV